MEKGLQFRRTDKAIREAFMKLVLKKGFEHLTVQEIIEEALVSRNTFYHHFHDKYKIAEVLFEEVKEQFAETLWSVYGVQGLERAKTESPESDDVQEIEGYKQFFEENGYKLQVLYKIKTDKVDMENFVRELFEKRYRNAPSNEGMEKDLLQLESQMYAEIFSAISKYFLKRESIDTYVQRNGIVEDALIDVFLYALGIIEKTHALDAQQYIQQCAKDAKKHVDNYQR